MIAILGLAVSLAAQPSFAAGLTDLYAFNGPVAAAHFVDAERAQPDAVLAYWGEALARGSDLNTGLTAARFLDAQTAIRKAAPYLAAATAQDQALVNAVMLRYKGSYADRDADETAYRTAMEAYVAQYPQDDDGTMILVEDLMERHGMSWNDDGTPLGDTSAEILRLTQTVLARTPQHLFANHLCIHVYDNAPDRTAAIPCAQKLDAMTFTEDEEHLAHMPSHTWIELGDGKAAVNSSERAWTLEPTRYAEHDAYVALAAAMMCGDAAATEVWRERLAALEGGSANLQPSAAIISARKSEASGNIDAAVATLEAQVAKEASLTELAPLFPADEALGALLLRAGRYAQARDVYQAILAHHPRRPRALYGMSAALDALGDKQTAEQYRKAFALYWAGASNP